MRCESLKSSTDENLRQVTWHEVQAAAKEAEIDLLERQLKEQQDQIKDLEIERRQGRSQVKMFNVMDADEILRQADASALQWHALKVQRAWRSRQARNKKLLKAVIFIQFRIRRWRRRRERAARSIQTRWSGFRRLKALFSR